MAVGWIVAAVLTIVVLALVRRIRLLNDGDADLVLQRCSLVPDFYRNKVVWVTGASSGSKLRSINIDDVVVVACCRLRVADNR